MAVMYKKIAKLITQNLSYNKQDSLENILRDSAREAYGKIKIGKRDNNLNMQFLDFTKTETATEWLKKYAELTKAMKSKAG